MYSQKPTNAAIHEHINTQVHKCTIMLLCYDVNLLLWFTAANLRNKINTTKYFSTFLYLLMEIFVY